MTGGFGEDSCHACHFSANPNDDQGTISLSGFPEHFTPGETYELKLTVSRPEMAVAGFQLSIRHADDMAQAGVVEVPPQEERRVGVTDEGQVLFAHQLLDGADLEDSDSARWALSWTAPDTAKRVVVHVAGLAGDGDDSQLGDHVYTLEAVAEPKDTATR